MKNMNNGEDNIFIKETNSGLHITTLILPKLRQLSTTAHENCMEQRTL